MSLVEFLLSFVLLIIMLRLRFLEDAISNKHREILALETLLKQMLEGKSTSNPFAEMDNDAR
jgi:hypothetical protein